MLVVADATPVNILIRIEHVGILPQLFDRVVIPPAVARELTDANTPDVVRAWMRIVPAWLEVRAPRMIDVRLNIGAGEREAIALAQELRAEVLLVDDRKARRAALAVGLQIAGTVGVLERAARRGFVDLREALARLRNTDFAVAAWILDEALAREEQRRGRAGPDPLR